MKSPDVTGLRNAIAFLQAFGAIALAFAGRDGWGWMLFVAWLISDC